jgi:PAS domain S-box-containing protein
MKDTLRILFNEDVKLDLELIWRELKKNNIVFEELLVDNKKDFIAGLKSFDPELIISDYSLPQFNGMQALLIRNEMSPLTPFLLVTGSNNETVAVDCMKAGADDYILKDNLSRLGPSVNNAINRANLLREKYIAEELLRQSEEKYRSIFENVQDVYYETAMDGTILNMSPSISIVTKGQYSMADLIGKSMYDFYYDTDDRQSIVTALTEKGRVPDFEIRLKNRDGSAVPFSISAKISLNALGKPEKIIGSMRDISERKKAEEALQQNLVFSDSLLRTIPFGMEIVDETGAVLFLSENLKRLFGEDAIGEKCWNLYRDNKTQCIGCPLRKGIIVGETESYESDGVLGERIFEINHTGMIYRGKRAMLEIFQDITDRKISEAELISAKEKAEEGDKLKTAFLHNISHEIRTPMNAIVGFCALLGDPEADYQTRQTYIEIIVQGSNHLLSIISDIMDISNIVANLVKIGRNEMNLNAELKALYDKFSPKAKEKEIRFLCNNGLSDEDALIITDSAKLIKILSNLLSNAFKFTERGSVNVEYKKEGSFLQFSVIDTGIGIHEKFHEKIFDRFFQVESSDTRPYEGTGLGLAISSAYVGLLEGKMWFTSEPGRGASFYFTIPYLKEVSASLPDTENQLYHDYVFKKKMKILVAEDVESNYRLISYFLQGANAELLWARNGKEAVERCLSDKSINLVLMDVKMPVMDGYTAATLIREANISIPIIAQTAYADDLGKAIESGCSGFIAKPFNKKSLLYKISEFINH